MALPSYYAGGRRAGNLNGPEPGPGTSNGLRLIPASESGPLASLCPSQSDAPGRAPV